MPKYEKWPKADLIDQLRHMDRKLDRLERDEVFGEDADIVRAEDEAKVDWLQRRVLRQERRIKWRNEQIASLKVQLAQVTHRADHYQARCRELAFEVRGINANPDHLTAALDELHGPLQ